MEWSIPGLGHTQKLDIPSERWVELECLSHAPLSATRGPVGYGRSKTTATGTRSRTAAQGIGMTKQGHPAEEILLRDSGLLKQERRGWCGIGHEHSKAPPIQIGARLCCTLGHQVHITIFVLRCAGIRAPRNVLSCEVVTPVCLHIPSTSHRLLLPRFYGSFLIVHPALLHHG